MKHVISVSAMILTFMLGLGRTQEPQLPAKADKTLSDVWTSYGQCKFNLEGELAYEAQLKAEIARLQMELAKATAQKLPEKPPTITPTTSSISGPPSHKP